MISPQSLLQGRYRILRALGEGGMGTVYEAIDERLDCRVALKQARFDTDEARRAFQREASLLANLRHRALPNVMDHFSDDEGQFLVMEFIPGDDLGKLLASGRSFAVEEVLRWAELILKTLEYLHKRNPPIIHRDIKPPNLILTEDDELFLLDFGLAKGSTGQMQTMMTTRSVLGHTLVYAPVEQILGTGTDEQSDLYALGATLYHLLGGKKPIDAATRYEANERAHSDPLQPLHEVNQKVPRAVSDVIAQSMALSRKDRPASAGAMRIALIATSENKTGGVTKQTRRRWNEETFFADASTRVSTEHLAALRSLFEWSREQADNIRFGTGVDTGSFSVGFTAVCVRSIFTARSDGVLYLNFPWLDKPESAKTWREHFGRSLQREGFSVPVDFVERYLRLPDREWVSRIVDFIKILSSEKMVIKRVLEGGSAVSQGKWTEDLILQTIQEKRGVDEARAASQLIDWSKQKASHINWGKGSNDGSFCPVFDLGSGYPFIPFRVYTYGSVEILFNRMAAMQNAPFDADGKRLELLDRLNKIPGFNLPRDGFNRRPSIRLALLKSPISVTMFLQMIEQAVEDVNRYWAAIRQHRSN